MLFSKNKKLQRDRDAGLVFRWRGGYASNRGGSTIAFLLTSFVFVTGFVLFNVYAKPSTVPSRYRASMIQLGPMDDDLSWWVERNSPNLPAWTENRDAERDAHVNLLLAQDLRDFHTEEHGYVDAKMQQIEIDDEGIYTMNDGSLPSVGRLAQADAVNSNMANVPEVDWKLELNVDGPLKARQPDAGDLINYGNRIPEKWRGRSVRFIVAIDTRGKVLSVNPAEWTDEKTVRNFENWLHTIQFKPANEAGAQTMTAVINLIVKPIIIKKEVKEEQP